MVEKFGAGRWVACGVVLAVSGITALAVAREAIDEWAYLLEGRETEATIAQMTSRHRESYAGLGNKTLVWETDYTFTEPDGAPRAGSDDMWIKTELRPGGTVRVRYTPGPNGRSRLAETDHRPSLWVFATAVGLMGASSLPLVTLLFRRRASTTVAHVTQE